MAEPGAGTRAAESIRRREQIYDAKEGWGTEKGDGEATIFREWLGTLEAGQEGKSEIRNEKSEPMTKQGDCLYPSPVNPGRCALGCLAENRLSLRN